MRNPIPFLLCLVIISANLHARSNTDIQWFKGSTDQAFDTAREQDKPIFLYWGAKWCPPCNQLKSTLFKAPAFINKTRLFVPVYLDGDRSHAQAQGEKFNVLGYPTLIIFNPQGREITRIPGGMDLNRYTDVLDLALNDIQPVKQLVDKIIDQDYRPTDKELQLLAYYSWQQDAGQATSDRDKLMLYRRLSKLTPEHMTEENSHFNAEYLMELVKLEEPLGIEVSLEGMQRLARILDNPVNTRSNLEFVVYEGKDVISKLTEDSPSARKHMADKWEASLNRLADNDQLTTEERLELHRGAVELFKLREQPIPSSLKRQIRYDVTEALSAVDNDYQSIALTYQSYSLLHASEQNKEAEKLLTRALKQDSNSHYWMLILAGMAKDEERKEDAINLYRQAYEISQGLATRLQWGSYYMDSLTRLLPQNIQQIEQLSNELITALQQQKAPFHGRNNRVLKRINKSLAEWAKTDAQKKLAEHFRSSISTLCLSKNSKPQCAMLEESES
jgi:thioredoxin-related protein